jgi:hypothetical protein
MENQQIEINFLVKNQEIEISFLNVDLKTAGEHRVELQKYIEHNAPGVGFSVKRKDENALDPGSILVLILSSKLAIEIAKAIVKGFFDWVNNKNTIKLKVIINKKPLEIEYHKGMTEDELATVIHQAATAIHQAAAA